MSIKKIIVILTISNFSCSGVAYLQSQNAPPTILTEKSCVTIPFHYVVVENWEKSSDVREVEIFMDAKSFSLENLNTLFSFLSNKFPEPKRLTLRVKTDWSQLKLPTDCPGSGSGSNSSKKEDFDYHRADYYRRGEDVYFYYTKELKTEKMEKVVLSGTHQPRQAWESK